MLVKRIHFRLKENSEQSINPLYSLKVNTFLKFTINLTVKTWNHLFGIGNKIWVVWVRTNHFPHFRKHFRWKNGPFKMLCLIINSYPNYLPFVRLSKPTCFFAERSFMNFIFIRIDDLLMPQLPGAFFWSCAFYLTPSNFEKWLFSEDINVCRHLCYN